MVVRSAAWYSENNDAEMHAERYVTSLEVAHLDPFGVQKRFRSIEYMYCL
jgi:hypothetical protein